MGFTCGYPWEVSCLSFGLLVRRPSWDLPHEFYCWEGSAMSCLCCLGQVPSKGTIIYPSKWPSKPLEFMRFYFFSKGKLNFLIVVDAYSQWLEAAGGNPHDSMTSLKTIEVLRTLFALYGMPEEVVSDNGPQLASEVFTQCCQDLPGSTVPSRILWSCWTLCTEGQGGFDQASAERQSEYPQSET